VRFLVPGVKVRRAESSGHPGRGRQPLTGSIDRIPTWIDPEQCHVGEHGGSCRPRFRTAWVPHVQPVNITKIGAGRRHCGCRGKTIHGDD
jgi:hypothetical protein